MEELQTDAAIAPETAPDPTVAERPSYPWVTIGALAISFILFFGILIDGSPEAVFHWGYRDAFRVWNGAVWALTSSAFVHEALWHLGLNAYWLWKLGTVVEPVMGRRQMIAFLIVTAYISSAAQLAVSGSTGIGASGVVYALFGFAWMIRGQHESIQKLLDKNTVTTFFAWIVLCSIFLTRQVGNAAHFAGLVAGVLTAEVFVLKRRPRLARAGSITLLVVSLGVSFICPWSGTWWSVRGYAAHEGHKYRRAVGAYQKSLSLDPDQPWVLQNLALAQHSVGDDAGAGETIKRLRALDPRKADEAETAIRSTQGNASTSQ